MSAAGDAAGDTAHMSGVLVRRIVHNAGTWFWALVAPPRGRRPAGTSLPRLLAGAAVAVAAVAVAMVYLDAALITQQQHVPRWVVLAFEFVTDAGRSGWLLGPLAVLLLIAAALSSPALGRMGQGVLVALVVRIGFVFFAVGVPGLVVTIAKRLIGRARPWVTGEVVPFTFDPFNLTVEYASLPSGHGTTAFAAAVAIGSLYPRARIPLWAFAVLVAVSRVVTSVHFPSDVLAGAVIGAFGALVVRNWFAARRLGFGVAPDGAVVTRPGPSLRRIRGLTRRFLKP